MLSLAQRGPFEINGNKEFRNLKIKEENTIKNKNRTEYIQIKINMPVY